MKLLISGYKPKKKHFWDKLKRHLPTPTPREVLPNTNKPPSYSKFDPSFIIDKNISHHESFSNINGDKWLSDLLNEKNVHHMQHLCRELQKPDRYFGQIYKKLMCEIPSPQKSGGFRFTQTDMEALANSQDAAAYHLFSAWSKMGKIRRPRYTDFIQLCLEVNPREITMADYMYHNVMQNKDRINKSNAERTLNQIRGTTYGIWGKGFNNEEDHHVIKESMQKINLEKVIQVSHDFVERIKIDVTISKDGSESTIHLGNIPGRICLFLKIGQSIQGVLA